MAEIDAAMSGPDSHTERRQPLFVVAHNAVSIIACVMDGPATLVAWMAPTWACFTDSALSGQWLKSAWQTLKSKTA
jgi:hypothetical protein